MIGKPFMYKTCNIILKSFKKQEGKLIIYTTTGKSIELEESKIKGALEEFLPVIVTKGREIKPRSVQKLASSLSEPVKETLTHKSESPADLLNKEEKPIKMKRKYVRKASLAQGTKGVDGPIKVKRKYVRRNFTQVVETPGLQLIPQVEQAEEKLETTPTLKSLEGILLENIKKTESDAGFLAQANSILEQVKTLVEIIRMSRALVSSPFQKEESKAA